MHKNLGPLVSAEEMSRCIHCTRCVRFGQEVAGVMELGMYGRGEHSEILPFVGRTVDSELSGNMIDVCPVGALTSKPFRYSARTWELARRKSIAPHDSLGSNLIVQAKGGKVMRVVPFENEAVNECWISDRDRFSYEALNSSERLTKPMVRDNGQLRETDWQTALDRAGRLLRGVREQHGGEAIGLLANPQSTFEDMTLAARLMRGLGSENMDFRLRQIDFSADRLRAGVPWLGMSIAELAALDRVLIVGSFLRKDQPLLANRFRQAAKRAQQINVLNVADDDWLMNVRNKAIVRPSKLGDTLAQIVIALAKAKQLPVPAGLAADAPSEAVEAIAASLASGRNTGIVLGAVIEQHAQYARLQSLAQELAKLAGAKWGFLGTAANSLGGYLAGCLPNSERGLPAIGMLASPRKAYVLLNVEPEFDCHNPAVAVSALRGAEAVIALSTFRSQVDQYAQVVLPIAPFTETAGSFVNMEGRMQSFNAVVKPLGDARPAWKVLRVLGEQVGATNVAYDSSEAVRDSQCKSADVAAKLDNGIKGVALTAGAASTPELERVADVLIYGADPIVRRAESLQATRDAREPLARMHPVTAGKLKLNEGDVVSLRQGGAQARAKLSIDAGVPEACVRYAAGHAGAAALGPMFGEISVEKIS